MMRLLFLLCCLPAAACATSTLEKLEVIQPAWVLQQSGVTASLRGVSAVNPSVAWASGSEGTCLRTLDGGENWEIMAVPNASSLDFRDVQGVSDKIAYLLTAGAPARIYKTLDGGQHWTLQYENNRPGVFFDSMAFWDDQRGLAFSDPVEGAFLVIRTENGGRTWLPVPGSCLPTPHPKEAGFAASGTCVAVHGTDHAWIATGGSAARVIRTTDGGKSWRAAGTPMRCGEPSQGIFSIAFMDEDRGVIVGGDYQDPSNPEGNAAITENGGKSWQAIHWAQPDGFRSCVACITETSPPVLVAVGTSGADYSRDLGRTWIAFDDQGFHSVSFIGSHGWAVGGEGTIARFQLICPVQEK